MILELLQEDIDAAIAARTAMGYDVARDCPLAQAACRQFGQTAKMVCELRVNSQRFTISQKMEKVMKTWDGETYTSTTHIKPDRFRLFPIK